MTDSKFAERIKHHLDCIGPKKVIALVTDNAANMRSARELVTKEKLYKHIIPLRCVPALHQHEPCNITLFRRA